MSTATVETLAPPATAGTTAVRVPDPGSFRRPSLVRLTGIEFRKAVDTRSGRVLLLAVVGLALAGLAWRIYNAANSPVAYEHFLSTAIIGVQAVLPVVGVMAMTSEWTQRTALSTFTATGRRLPVLVAKVITAQLLGLLASIAVMGATAAATVVGGAVTGTDPSFDGFWKLSVGWTVANMLNMLMAAGFGALVPQTAAAVTIFLVVPTLWSSAGPALFKDLADWLDVYGAFWRFSQLDADMLGQSLTSIGVWIVVPLTVGIAMSLRREVK